MSHSDRINPGKTFRSNAKNNTVDPLPEERAAPRPRKRGRPRGATGGRKIGKDVPTITCHLEPEAAACPSCGGERKTIRTEAAERLHYVPASYVQMSGSAVFPGSS